MGRKIKRREKKGERREKKRTAKAKKGETLSLQRIEKAAPGPYIFYYRASGIL